jgi:hypothetical protein
MEEHQPQTDKEERCIQKLEATFIARKEVEAKVCRSETSKVGYSVPISR